MGISGSLKTMQLSELLQWLAHGQKTGILLIEGGGVEKRVYFDKGRIYFTSSSDHREYLGHFLVSHGYINEEELKKAMEVQEESKILLGKILLMINAISETDLLRLLRSKAEESIYDVFLWDDGKFEFSEGALSDRKMVPIALDVTGIILEGLHRYDEWKRIRLQIPNASVVPKIVHPLTLEGVSEKERLILPHIDGHRSIEEIALETHNSEFPVARLVFNGLTAGSMALVETEPRRAAVAAGGGLAESEVESFLERGWAKLVEEPHAAYRMFRAAHDLDPSDGRATEAVREAERKIRSTLERDGVTGEKVPELAVSPVQLTEEPFSPHEGFVLSRINGQWNVKSIMQISPMRELEVLMIVQQMLAKGIIRWKIPAKS